MKKPSKIHQAVAPLTKPERIAQAALRGFFGDALGFNVPDKGHKNAAALVEKMLDTPSTTPSVNVPANLVPTGYDGTTLTQAIIALLDTYPTPDLRDPEHVTAWDRVRIALLDVPVSWTGSHRFPITREG